MTTTLGKFLRKLRIDREEILFDMARNLGVSPAFLSAVENGKKKAPDSWSQKISELYNLSPSQIEELNRALTETKTVVEINIRDSSPQEKELALTFARSFESLDKDTTEKIIKLLTKHKEK